MGKMGGHSNAWRDKKFTSPSDEPSPESFHEKCGTNKIEIAVCSIPALLAVAGGIEALAEDCQPLMEHASGARGYAFDNSTEYARGTDSTAFSAFSTHLGSRSIRGTPTVILVSRIAMVSSRSCSVEGYIKCVREAGQSRGVRNYLVEILMLFSPDEQVMSLSLKIS